MICLVLAAGYATRLYPLTENFPKPLLKVGEKTILNWLLDDVNQLDEVSEIVVISNHKFISHFQDWAKQQSFIKQLIVLDDGSLDNDHRLGAVKDMIFAREQLNIQDDLLVLAGDNVLDFSLREFIDFVKEKKTSCVMCHEENDLAKQQRTAIIVKDSEDLIVSYEEKPKIPKGNLAVPPFYYYLRCDAARMEEAIMAGCSADAPGSFAAWLSKQTNVHAWTMSGRRHDIGDLNSYQKAQNLFSEL